MVNGIITGTTILYPKCGSHHQTKFQTAHTKQKIGYLKIQNLKIYKLNVLLIYKSGYYLYYK